MQKPSQPTRPRPVQLKTRDKSLSEIDEANIWKDDDLGRDRDAINLEGLMDGQEGPLTLCLDGAWGTGKTFFLRRFESQWKANGGTALYFNAWEDDNLDDPLIALIGQLWPILRPSGMTALVDDIKKCALPLLKRVALDHLGVDTKEVTSPAGNVFDEYEGLQASRRQLKECVSKVADHFFNKSSRPLLFIIDELDRCRPSFSVALLERIKHLFPIRHLVFLVGVDREQLKASIRAVYGDIDAENYLHRFFDATLKLSQYSPRQFVYATYGHASGDGGSPTTERILSERSNFALKLCPLIQHFDLSLREVEVAIRTYTLIPPVCSEAGGVMMIGLLIVLGMRNPVAYFHLINWDLPIGKLVDEIFGNLREYADLDNDSSPISFIKYLYRLEMMFDEGTSQQKDLLNLVRGMEEGTSYTVDSPLIATFLRERGDFAREFLVQVRRSFTGGHSDFRKAFYIVHENLQHIGDIRLS